MANDAGLGKGWEIGLSPTRRTGFFLRDTLQGAAADT